jgi:AraC-like DNA-binding protein
MARARAHAEWTEYATAAVQGVELLHAHFTRHVYERHSHDSYAIGVTEWGVQAFNCRGASHASTVGRVIAFNPVEPHDGYAGTPDGFTYRMLYLEPTVIERVLDDACGRPAGLPFFATPILHDPRLARLVAATHRAFAESASALERDAALTDMIVHLATRHADGRHRVPRFGEDHAAVRRVRDYLHAAYGDDVTTDDLARVAGLSRFHLSRLFSKAYGLAPHAYQLQLRLAEAKRLLAVGEPVVAAAAAVGFADQSHLHKRFKGAFGITPGQFARACRDRRGDATRA